MAYMIIYVFIIYISSTYCLDVPIQPNVHNSNGNVEIPKQVESDKDKQNDNKPAQVNIKPKTAEEKPIKDTPSEVVATTSKTTNESNVKSNTNTDVEAGAVLRGVFVFVGITLLFIMYLTYKTYRKRNKKNVLIKKYGVKTRRTDVEMEPLPLDDDEEDETVFDLGNVNNR